MRGSDVNKGDVRRLELQDTEGRIVIRESAISDDPPVIEEICAVCLRPSEEAVAAFKQRFKERGKARTVLEVTIEEQGLMAVRFKGTFVAMP